MPINKNRYSRFTVIFCIISLFLASCGSQQRVTDGFGSIVVQAIWPGQTAEMHAAGIFRAAPVGVTTVRMTVSGPGMSNKQADFAASTGMGAISAVPAGSSRVVTLRGLNSGGTVIYYGQSSPVIVTDGKTSTTNPVVMSAGDGSTAPAAPTGVSASSGNAQNTITWIAVTGATSYNLYWSTTSGVAKTNGTKITGATSPYTHTGRTNGTTYYYIVTAVNNGGESAASAQASVTPQVPTPGAPTGVSVSSGNMQNTIAWSTVTGATSYNLYWSTASGVTKTSGTKITGATSPYTHTGRTNGTTYYYVVTAVNAGGESANSSQASATPQVPAAGAPTGVSATPGNAQNTIVWSAVTGATSYNIYWSLTSGVTKANGTKITGATSPYTHTGRTNGTTYYYVVTAVNTGGESADSSQAGATPQVSAASSPTGVSATPGNGQNTINWSAATGATSYNLYWSLTSGVTKANGTKITGVTSPYTHTGRTNGTTYYYVVTAVNAGGESADSSQASATPQVPAAGAPTGVLATPGNGQNTISWSVVTGATSYNIYWSTTSGVTKANGTKITAAASPYTHASLTNGTTYYYVVTAVNGGGESSESTQVSATPQIPAPGAPTNVTTTAGNLVTITWFAVSGATSYNVYWSTTSGVTKATGTKISNATSPHLHMGVTIGTTYYYVVSAVNAGGESAESSQVNATPQACTTGIEYDVPDTGQTTVYATGDDGSYLISAPSYTDNGNGTITDNVTGLVWQKQDDATTRTWDAANTYCINLSLAGTGWRMPTDFELMTIVDYGKYGLAIDITYFPGTQSSYYWSSTTNASSTTSAWIVNFNSGIWNYNNKTYYNYTRCVR